MTLSESFNSLAAGQDSEPYSAIPFGDRARDFLAKAPNGLPVFLIQDAAGGPYEPGVALANITVQYQTTCQVTTPAGTFEGMFAVVGLTASDSDLHDLFIESISSSLNHLPPKLATSDIAKLVNGLVRLFLHLTAPSKRELTGLWAELYLIADSRDPRRALAAWHTGPNERFDFSESGWRVEVKATTGEQRIHEFSLEQLKAPSGGVGYVASLLLQIDTAGPSIIDLARRISERVGDHPVQTKLWDNLFSILGNQVSIIGERRYDLTFAARNLALFAMDSIPAPTVDPSEQRVTAVRFRSDLSGIEPMPHGKHVLDMFERR